MVGLLAVLLASLVVPVHAGEVLIDKFGGLNTNDASVAIAPDASQDLLNVEITPGGTSVRKRGGYGLHKTLNVSTSAVHGAHYFQDINGSDVQLWGNDYFLNASVNGASPIRVATGTLAATWQCTDSVGYAYCVTSARDMPVRTAGTAATAATYLSGVPLGTMITATPDRLVVAGVSGNESTLYFSKLNTFPTFTTGVNEADGFTEVINSPGSRITHIRYACGKVLWWKDGSFGYSLGTDQYNLENVTISPNIGTLDNSSDEYNGNVYFRGQDSHVYVYDCANVTRLSRAITPTVQGANRRRSNSWTQDSQSEFQAGTATFTSNGISLTSVPGSIVLTTGTVTYSTSADFSLGVTSNTEVTAGVVRISTSNTNIANNGFESASTANDWTEVAGQRKTTQVGSNCTINPRTGSYFFQTPYGAYTPGFQFTTRVSLIDNDSNVLSYTDFTSASNSCSWTQRTISVGDSLARRAAYIQVKDITNNQLLAYSYMFQLSGKDITFYSASDYLTTVYGIALDDFADGRSAINLGWYRTPTYDTGLTESYLKVSSTFTGTAAAFSNNVTLSVTDSSDGSSWSSAKSPVTNQKVQRYVQFISTWSRSDALSGYGLDANLSTTTFVFTRSSNTYLSSVNNASGVSSWDIFTSNFDVNGGTVVFYVRASTGSFTVLSSTPLWYAQSPNATVNYATGTYMQTRIDFSVTSATQNPTVNDFSFNWFEGSASDKAYIKFWNDYVWVAVSSGTSGLNNRILRWDTVNQAWLLDDIPMNGMIVDNNRLYFGSPTAGKVYVYDNSLKTDDSGPIESYWKSKDFVGNDPFTTNTWDQADFIVKQASGTYLTTTYTLDTTSSTVITLNLYDPLRPNGTLMRKGNNLAGAQGTFVNVKVGDDSSNDPWEVYGIRFKYAPLPWKPK